MIQQGISPSHVSCDELIDSLCLQSTEPCALLDPLGRIRAASSLFLAVAAVEPALDALLLRLHGTAASDAPRWANDGWLVGRGLRLDGADRLLVHLYGPAVVRARLVRLVGSLLSAREGECLAIALQGAENTEIAERLGVRPETVKVHLRNAYRKLRAKGRADLLARLVAA